MTGLQGVGEHVLVLRVGTFREIDCWVRFFSPLRGMETAFAFGGRRSRRRFPGCLDNFNHLRVDLQAPRSGRYLALSEGTLVHRFARLQDDMRTLGMAVNCIKFLEAAHIGPDQASSVFDLVLKTLHVLDEYEEIPASFPLFFRSRLTCTYGYTPDVDYCGLCHRPLTDNACGAFSWQEGYALCEQCMKMRTPSRACTGIDLRRLKMLMLGDPQVWVEQGWPAAEDRALWQALDMFVEYHSGLRWDGGRFRRG